MGAGGFGREVLLWARDAWPEQAANIAGFLSADAPAESLVHGVPGQISPLIR